MIHRSYRQTVTACGKSGLHVSRCVSCIYPSHPLLVTASAGEIYMLVSQTTRMTGLVYLFVCDKEISPDLHSECNHNKPPLARLVRQFGARVHVIKVSCMQHRMLQYPGPDCCHGTVRDSRKHGASTPAVARYCVLRRCSSSLRPAPCPCIRRVPREFWTALRPGKRGELLL